MSVCDPRPAAAQRTAAAPRTTRIILSWVVAVPLLAFFSFSVVAGAATFGGRPPLEQALHELPDTTKVVVQLQAPDPGNEGIVDRLTHATKLICTVNTTQLAAIQHAYRTTVSTFTVAHRTVQVATVYGANERSIRGYLGDNRCVLVQVAQIFFLPIDMHTS